MKSLATNILDVTLDKHWHVQASNWEAQKLNQRQIKYATNDVLTANCDDNSFENSC